MISFQQVESETTGLRDDGQRAKTVVKRGLRMPSSLIKNQFRLLRRQATGVTSRHAFHHSTSARTRSNFFHNNNSGRGAASKCQPLALSSGKRIAGKTTKNDQEKVGVVAVLIVKASEGDPEQLTDGCRRQTEEAKQRECRCTRGRTSRNSQPACTARGHCAIDAAHDRRQVCRYSGTGRWSWTGLG